MIKITERINKNNNTSTNNVHKWLPYSVLDLPSRLLFNTQMKMYLQSHCSYKKSDV